MPDFSITNIIIDESVVEFYYDTSSAINDKFRWKPIRTRHDKTEAVKKYNHKYGRNFIWSPRRSGRL
jgi:hypothetical protein